MDTKSYTIGEVAEKTGLSVTTLRYYDKEGLLPFVERTPSGQRRYKERDLNLLAVIECLKATGMSIREIRQYIDWYKEGDSTLQKRLALFERQKEIVEKQIRALKEKQYIINCKVWYYQTAIEAGTEIIHNGSCTQLYEAHLKEQESQKTEKGEEADGEGRAAIL